MDAIADFKYFESLKTGIATVTFGMIYPLGKKEFTRICFILNHKNNYSFFIKYFLYFFILFQICLPVSVV